MKNLIRFGLAGALVAGYATAQAQNLPSTGNSDLWLFVSNQSAGTTFAEDTGQSLSGLAPTSAFATAGTVVTLSTSISANFTLGPSTALTNYINAAKTAGQTLEWAVEGIQFPGTISGLGFKKPGGIVGIFDNVATQDSNIAQITLGNMQNWGAGFQGDAAYMKPTYVTNGTSYAFGAGSTAGNVWGSTGPGGQAGSTNLYGQGPDQSGVGLGQSVSLYALTGNGNLGLAAQSYVLGRNLTLGTDGTLSVSGAAVPLPAADWLFGSGLLGLLGVARRRGIAA